MPPKAKQAKKGRNNAKLEAATLQADEPAGPSKAPMKRRDREEVPQDEGAERQARRRRVDHNADARGAPDGPGSGSEVEPMSSRGRPAAEPPLELPEEEIGAAMAFMDAVVKVFAVHSEPNFSLPWQRKRQFSSTSSGFIIDGRRILTNAHSVDHHTQVKVRRRGSDTKFIAKVLSNGPECDIAMLTVEDESFWENIRPVQFGVLPRLQESVTVIGFPIGGDTMSVSSGVVSRIEVTAYAHGATALLGVQIDAAINAGNSGGPAFNNRGECIGIAFQSLKNEDTENIGYIIPPPVVEHFINDYERNGRSTGFPILGVDWQKMESPYLRKALGMKAGQKGVLVRDIQPTANASKHLEKGDILLSFNGTEIANDGTVPFRSGERINFSYLVTQLYTGDKATLRILRNGAEKTVELQLSPFHQLVPVHLNNRPPSYFIIAGLVFTHVSIPYLKGEYGKDYDFDSPVKLLDKLIFGKAHNPDEQLVVLGQCLAADVNIGYEDLINYPVRSVNGRKIERLQDLVEAVDSCKEEYLRFDLEYNQVVLLETKAAGAATKDILDQHYITQDRSADLIAKPVKE